MASEYLHPGAKWVFRLLAYSYLIVLGVFLTIWSFNLITVLVGGSVGLAFVLAAILYIIFILIAGEIYARMSYNRWFYDFTPTNLRMERGIIWKRYSNVPYERIQNVDIQRGIIARILGFSSVLIQTAGYSMPVRGRGYNAEGYIPAVSVDRAEKIREFVMRKITKKSNSGL